MSSAVVQLNIKDSTKQTSCLNIPLSSQQYQAMMLVLFNQLPETQKIQLLEDALDMYWDEIKDRFAH